MDIDARGAVAPGLCRTRGREQAQRHEPSQPRRANRQTGSSVRHPVIQAVTAHAADQRRRSSRARPDTPTAPAASVESTSFAGRCIAVLGQGGSARAIVAKLGAHGAAVAVHPPGRWDRLAVADMAHERLDGVLVVMPRAARNSVASDAVTAAMLCSPRWLLMLAPGTDPAEAGRAALALDR